MGAHFQHASHDPQDILRRFTETPLKSRFILSNFSVLVETNDSDLLPKLCFDPKPSTERYSFRWKLVRDTSCEGDLEDAELLVAGPVTLLHMGSACLVALDQDRHEILSFIGNDVTPNDFHDVVLPLLLKLTQESLPATDTPRGEFSKHRIAGELFRA